MRYCDHPLEFAPLPGAIPAGLAEADPESWQGFAEAVRAAGGQLVALWGNDERERKRSYSVSAAYRTPTGLALVRLAVKASKPAYPDLTGIFPAASRMQRATYDLLGIIASDAEDRRPWLRHSAWPEDVFPLRKDFDPQTRFPDTGENYDFVRVEGEGVHEIPVGPVHAGIIEPGHFRFSVVGEKVLRLEERLGYQHKGMEKRFEQLSVAEGYRLAGRVSGDSTVAYAWAYAQAAEALAGTAPPPRAQWLRALLLERERVANHLGDLGALGNDAALGFGLAQFMVLREDWLRLNAKLFGHRLLMDRIVPGGVARDLLVDGGEALLRQCAAIETQVHTLRAIYDDHSGLQDRFLSTGRLDPTLATQLGVTGIAGRASGQDHDLRRDFPLPPYDQLQPGVAKQQRGDVAARANIRFDEVFASLSLLRRIVAGLPSGPCLAPLAPLATDRPGIGWIEGWRGDVLVALEAEADGRIRRCHCHDPSWQNWPAIEWAIHGNIVPDFPLINKSFNLSYAGQDL